MLDELDRKEVHLVTVTQVMGQTDGLGQVLVQGQGAGHGTTDLGHFNGMGQTGAVIVIQTGGKDLGLALQTPERRAVNHPIPIPLEIGAIGMGRLIVLTTLGRGLGYSIRS